MQHVYDPKEFAINSSSSLTLFDQVYNITVKYNVEGIAFEIMLYT